jgi:hypothetical protein
LWSDSQVTQTATNLAPGNYDVNVTDANGCTEMASVTITEPTPLEVECIVTTASSPGASDGSATALVTGGTPPYTYLWSTGETTHTIDNLAVGIYTVTVTDANGCVETHDCEVFVCEVFRTQTQGGWGAKPRGNNPGVYLHNNFAGAFPSGLTVGCTNTLVLTSAQAVTDFLPTGSSPSALPAGTIVDPGGTYNNVLAGQVVALTISLGFDAYDPGFSPAPVWLGDLIITSGTFTGWTIADLLQEANNALGGCGSIYSFSELNNAISSINENYVDGTTDLGFVGCSDSIFLRSAMLPATAEMAVAATEIALAVYPNPFQGTTNIEFTLTETSDAQLIVYDLSGKEVAILFNAVAEADQVYRVNFDAENLNAGVFTCRLVTPNKVGHARLILLR